MSEAITRTDLTEILNAVLPAIGLTQTELLRRKQITANSTHTLNDDISNYDAFVITVFNNPSAGSGQSTFITKAQLANDPTTVVAPMSFGTQYAIVGITGMSGTTLSVGFVNIAGGMSPYMSIIGLKFGASGGVEDVDHIVEEGTSGIWTYRKWESGMAELWASPSQTVSAYATNSFVLGSATVTPYPFAITNPKAQAYCLRLGSGLGVISYDYVRTDYWSAICCGVNQSIAQGQSMAIVWDLYIMARWK